MKKIILLFSLYLTFSGNLLLSQFTQTQIEELTAYGICSSLEPDNSAVQKKSLELTEQYKADDNVSQLCAVFDFIYKEWNYSKDPFGMEYFEKAGVSIYTMTGDCDDYAILMVSMLKSLGIDGRVICVSGHAYPEVYVGKDLTSGDKEQLKENINNYYLENGSKTKVRRLNYHIDKEGRFWLNMDYQQRYPGGRFFEYSEDAVHLVIYPDGSFERALLNNY
jgi:transglutaminase-like putative cysteine protease